MHGEVASLRSLIGGRWAVSWQGYLLGWPFALLFIFFSSPGIGAFDPWYVGLLKVVAVGTATYLPTGAVLWIAAKTLLRNRDQSPAPILTVGLVGGLAWSARSIALIAYLSVMEVPSQASPSLRMLAGFIQGVFALTLTAWFFATINDFYVRRRQLLRTLVSEELMTDRIAVTVDEMRTDVLQRVQETVDESVQQWGESMTHESITHQDVQVLRDASQKVSRVIAHDLWRTAERGSRLNPLTIVRSAATHRPFAYWGLLPTFILAMIILPALWPLRAAVLFGAGITAFAFAVSLIANKVVQRVTPQPALIIYCGAVVVLLIGTLAVVQVFKSILGLEGLSGGGLPWIAAANFGVMYPLIGIAANVGRAKQEVLDQIRQSISYAEIYRESLRQEEVRVTREIALALHGGVQAHFTAAGMRLSHALDEGDDAATEEAILQVKWMIASEIVGAQRKTADIDQVVNHLVDTWTGVVDITAQVHVRGGYTQRCVRVVQDVVTEGINNAVRHGDATHIDIEVRDAIDKMIIVIGDNGFGVSGSGVGAVSPGLGSAMLNAIATDSWSRVVNPAGGSVLTVEFQGERIAATSS